MPKIVTFQVVDQGVPSEAKPRTFWLVRDRWDDYHFRTTFQLIFVDKNHHRNILGTVKIGQVGMAPYSHTNLQRVFSSLDKTYFSLGQDREYYEALQGLGPSISRQVLMALNDIAISEERFAVAATQDVTSTSLLRNLSTQVVLQQFRRIAKGGVILTPYDFTYRSPRKDIDSAPILAFQVEPNSTPPSNVHVLIGSNGAGKTTLLTNMARTLVGAGQGQWGSFEHDGGKDSSFVNVVTVSFSAFDPFAAIKSTADLHYSYIGLKAGENGETVKTVEALAEDFAQSLEACTEGRRRDRWLAAMKTLNADPLLDESGVRELLVDPDVPLDLKTAAKNFDKLSSGHKIVVLTMTRLVQLVEEKTLTLLDEPEAHLHPPLLAAFTRALSDLLEDRNGVAIIATHSPVVLQEVPQSCVWTIRRSGSLVSAERLDIETFGEGVGTLTSSVFGLEVTSTGYHQLLKAALAKNESSYEGSLAAFDGKVGGEGRAILRSLARRKGN